MKQTHFMKVLSVWVAGIVLSPRFLSADEADCDVLDPVVAFDAVNNECDLDVAINKTGVFNLGHTLHIGPAGKINVTAAAGLVLNLPGDLIIDVPSGASGSNGISGNVLSSTFAGRPVTVNADGNITLLGDGSKGAQVTSTNLQATCEMGGMIELHADADGDKVGNVLVGDGARVDVSAARCPAGSIIITGRDIDVDGSVLSESALSGTGAVQRPGGGPITIDALCKLAEGETGLISSQGRDPGADLVHLEGGCDVTILGKVQSTGPGHSPPNAPANHCNNVTRPDKPAKSVGCVEIWSGVNVLIDASGPNNGEVNADVGLLGGAEGESWIDIFAKKKVTINGDSSGPFAVHANGGLGVNTDDGGVVTVKSIEDTVLTAGRALQASSTSNGGKGGKVFVEAGGAGSPVGDVGFGSGLVEAAGSNVGGLNQGGGKITARSFNGIVSGFLPGSLNTDGGMGDAEVGDEGVVTLQGCGSGAPGDGVAYGGTVVPPPAVILADACGGAPSLPAYVVLPDCFCDGSPGDGDCKKSSIKSVLDPVAGRFPGNAGPDVTIRLDLGETIQQAVSSATDVNSDGYIILLAVKDGAGSLGGTSVEKVDISQFYPKPFGLLACSVTLQDPDTGDGLPAGHIAASAGSPANIFVMDLHARGSESEGWLVDGNGRYMRNIKVSRNRTGISFVGHENTMHNGAAEENAADGVFVKGQKNLVTGVDAFNNGGDGIHVEGSGNTVSKADAGEGNKGNGGDGVEVIGDGNNVIENDAFGNGAHGVAVSGFGNQLKKNRSGDSGGSGNSGDGFRVDGGSNLLEENKAGANGGDGFNLMGAGNRLKKSRANDGPSGGSKENAGPEYKFLSGVLDLGGNRKDNGAFSGAGSPKTYAPGAYE